MFEKFIYLEVIQGYGRIKPGKVKIQQGKNGTFKFITSVWVRPAQYYIDGIRWQQSSERDPGKAVAGAVLGGIAAGSIGLILGTLRGSRKKDTSTAVISIDTDQGKAEILAKCSAREFQLLEALKNKK